MHRRWNPDGRRFPYSAPANRLYSCAGSLFARFVRSAARAATVTTLVGPFASSTAASQRASDQSWSVLQTVELPVGMSFLRWSSLASHSDTLVLVGSMPARSGAPRLDSDAALIWRIPGAPIAIPKRPRAVYYKLLYDRQHTLHLFWAEYDAGDNAVLFASTPRTSLWHTTHSLSGWSTPTAIVRGSSISWGADGGNLIEDSNGRIHLLVSMLDSSGYRTADLILEEGQWRRRNVDGVSTSLAVAMSSRKNVVALLSSRRQADQSGSILPFVLRDKDWVAVSRPLAVEREREIRNVALIRSTETLWAFWSAVQVSDGKTTFFWASGDTTDTTWHIRDSLEVDGIPRRISSSADGCGGTVSLAEMVGGRRDRAVELVELAMSAKPIFGAHRITPPSEAGLESSITIHKGRITSIYNILDSLNRISRIAVATRGTCGK